VRRQENSIGTWGHPEIRLPGAGIRCVVLPWPPSSWMRRIAFDPPFELADGDETLTADANHTQLGKHLLVEKGATHTEGLRALPRSQRQSFNTADRPATRTQ